MRYWHPMADQVVAEIKDFAPTQIMLLPLYPQFSTTTTLSSFRDFTRAMIAQHYHAPVTEICCYPFHDGFIAQSVINIKKAIDAYKEKYGDQPYRLLFSAHGLPQNVVDKGDPYQVQCEQSAEKMAKALMMPELDWQICYQSRVGPLKWIGPSTEEALEKAHQDNKGVIIYPHAFVSEHVETLVEIEEEYREMAEHMGLHAFQRVETVMAGPLFIAALGDIVKRFRGRIGAFSDQGGSLCPTDCAQCYLKIKDNPKCKI
jgi:ferrochelatase